MASRYLQPPTLTPWEFATAEWGLFGKYDSTSPIQSRYSPILPRVYRALLALRLMKTGGVSAEVAYDTLEYDYLASVRTTTPQHELRADQYMDDGYELYPNEIADLIDLYVILGKHTVESQLKSVTDRFQRAYTRNRLEDRLVDLAIAMETMLLYGVGSDKARNLSLRGAALLSDVLDTRYSTTLLRALYSARSKIVHAGFTLSEISRTKGIVSSLGADRFLSEVTEWARSGIRRCAARLATGESLMTLAKSLDRS